MPLNEFWALAMVLNPQATGRTATQGGRLCPLEALGIGAQYLASLPQSGNPGDSTRVYFQPPLPRKVGECSKWCKEPKPVCAFKSKTDLMGKPDALRGWVNSFFLSSREKVKAGDGYFPSR